MSPGIEVLLLVLGAGLIIAGAAVITWPAGLLALGVLLLLAVVDWGR